VIATTLWDIILWWTGTEANLDTSIVTQVVERLNDLPDELQRRVLEYVQALEATTVRDVPGSQLLQFAGTIPLEDLQVMAAAIEAGCEQCPS
jgi:hypothetical protein